MNSAGPPQSPLVDREALASHKKAALWSAVWEASQFLTYAQIRELVEGTIAEIVSDEP